MSTYVVAGVTGRVGSVVASELLAKDEKVRLIVRSAERGRVWTARSAELAVGSLEDRAFLTGALRGASGCFALLPEDPVAAEFHATRRRIADSIAAAVKQSGVPHVVMMSAISAHLPDRNGPGKDLHYLEQALRATATTLTAARACYFQENIAAVIAPAKQEGIYPGRGAPAGRTAGADGGGGRRALRGLRGRTSGREAIGAWPARPRSTRCSPVCSRPGRTNDRSSRAREAGAPRGSGRE